jgi:hypothetical protein
MLRAARGPVDAVAGVDEFPPLLEPSQLKTALGAQPETGEPVSQLNEPVEPLRWQASDRGAADGWLRIVRGTRRRAAA